MEPKQLPDTGTAVFYIRYRKILAAGCIFLLVIGLQVKIYDAPVFDQSHKYEDIGFLIDTALMFLILPVWMLITIRKAWKAYSNTDEWKKM
jgi:hypothetical protein